MERHEELYILLARRGQLLPTFSFGENFRTANLELYSLDLFAPSHTHKRDIFTNLVIWEKKIFPTVEQGRDTILRYVFYHKDRTTVPSDFYT